MQYTIRRIHAALDAALRQRARETGRSLNHTTLEALADGLGLSARRPRRTLGDIAGSWRREAAVEKALADHDRVDEDLWK